jgi:Ca2+-binding RTX toxin-like protein
VYLYGLKDKDHLEFVVSGGSQTQVFANGGDGVDDVTGGPNADFLDGGDVDKSKDTLHARGGGDLLAGGPGDDVMFGEDGEDALVGEAGVDTMKGGSGNDDLFGGADNDTIDGDNDSDLLFGGDGLDTLNGGAGRDYVSGGQDKKADKIWGGPDGDRFRAEGTEANNKDKPYDFHTEQGDRYVRSYNDAGAIKTATDVGWLALDASFADMGMRPVRRWSRV